MTTAATPTRARAVPRFDADRLMKQPMLTGPEAAFLCGFTHETYADPVNAFHHWTARNGIRPDGRAGRRLFFDRRRLLQRLQRAQAEA